MKPEFSVSGGQGVNAGFEKQLGKRDLWLSIGVGVAAFFFYDFILYHYYLGDPLYYQRYYDAVARMDFVSAFLSQGDYLGSSELIYPVIAWLGSTAGIERNTLMAAFDGAMYAILFAALTRNRCHPAFIILSMANFYLVVLSTSAERLKFSYIFLFLALMYSGRLKYLWTAMAPLAHFQSLITLGSILVWHFFSRFTMKVKVALVAVTFFGAAIIFYFFVEDIMTKFMIYQTQEGVRTIISGGLLLVASLFIFKNRFQAAFTILPLLVMTFVLGGSRMNMITFTVFLYMCLKEKKTGHPAVLFVMCYFVLQAVLFIIDVLRYGTGFGY